MSDSLDEQIVDPAIYADTRRYHELFRQLRREKPVRWTAPKLYRPFWTVSKHADIVEVQRQPEIFLSGLRLTLETRAAEDRIEAATGRKRATRSLLSMDGAEHVKMRALSQQWFLPRNLAKLKQAISAIARECLDDMAARGGRCDFSGDVAVWFSLRVILRLFGLPRDAEPLLLKLTREIAGAQDPDLRRSESQGEHALLVTKEFFAYFTGVAEDRRRQPREDIASVLANARIDGSPLSDLDLFSYYLVFAVAGHDTTSTSLAGGLLALMEAPEEFEQLRAHPEQLPLTVDEVVRWVHPVKHFMRTASRDYALRGQLIREGEALLMCLPSACRDEDVFDDPFRFRYDRHPNPHLGFGVGSHICLGQHLAKLELVIFFQEFLKRLDRIELDGEPSVIRSLFLSGFKSLPVSYSFH